MTYKFILYEWVGLGFINSCRTGESTEQPRQFAQKYKVTILDNTCLIWYVSIHRELYFSRVTVPSDKQMLATETS